MHFLARCLFLAFVVTAMAEVPTCHTDGYELIPKPDCKGYYICVFGRPVEMPDCPQGSVFSTMAHVCVPEDSIYNDCKQDDADIGSLTIEEQCALRSGALIPHPTECQAYYNCSHIHKEIPGYYEQYLQECYYPELFNIESTKCDNFENVKCEKRVEFKNACDYRRSRCLSAHCMPCYAWEPNCEGKPDGINAHEYRLWTPFYAVCYKERSMDVKVCPADSNGRTECFHPELNQCVSQDFIPKEHGGLMPDCTGLKDGFYLDDSGRCNQYTVCKDGKFLNIVKCMEGEVFDVLLEVCVKSDLACGPCGNRDC